MKLRHVLVCAAAPVVLAACGSSVASRTVVGGNGASTAVRSSTGTSHTSKSQSPATPAATTGSQSLAGDEQQADQVAANYVIASQSIRWSDLFDPSNGFATWAMNTKPYVTPSYWNTIAQLQEQAIKNGVNGSAQPMQQWEQEHYVQVAKVIGAGVATEAGVTTHSMVVQVTYALQTFTTSTPAGLLGPEQVMQVQVVNDNGHWLVNQQYPTPVG